jgi:hypothetical protein
MRRFSVILILLVVVVAVAAGLFGRSWLGRGGGQRQDAGAPATPAAVATSAPTAVSAAPPAAPPTAPPTRLAPPTAVPTPVSRDVVMELSESDLQTQLSTMLVGRSLGTTPLGDATIQTVTVALRDQQVKVGGAASAGFLNAPFTAAGTVTPNSAGRPQVKVSEATLGGVLLPDVARAALADTLQTQVDVMFAEQSMKVRTIEIADGKMRVVGTAGS